MLHVLLGTWEQSTDYGTGVGVRVGVGVTVNVGLGVEVGQVLVPVVQEDAWSSVPVLSSARIRHVIAAPFAGIAAV